MFWFSRFLLATTLKTSSTYGMEKHDDMAARTAYLKTAPQLEMSDMYLADNDPSTQEYGGFHLSRETTVSMPRFYSRKKTGNPLSATFDPSWYRPFLKHQLYIINFDITNAFVRNSRQESAYARHSPFGQGHGGTATKTYSCAPLVRKAA
jgi:hypothetical protein